jgi:hypothetical protein
MARVRRAGREMAVMLAARSLERGKSSQRL